MPVEYNKGNIAEAVLAAALGARFQKRFSELDFKQGKVDKKAVNVGNMKPITVLDVQNVLRRVVSNSARYSVKDFSKKELKTVEIYDDITVSVSIPAPDMNFLTKESNWALLSDIFNSAVAKVNQDTQLRQSAYSLSVNLAEDDISIRGIGTENQQGTKIDLLVEVKRQDKRVPGGDVKISLKYDAPQFAQSVGLEFENFGNIFNPLGLNNYSEFNQMFQEEVMNVFPDILGKRFDSRTAILESQEVIALKKVAKEVFQSITDELKSKVNDVGFKDQLARYCIEKATKNESGVELVKFTSGGQQYTQKFGEQFVENVKAQDFDATFDATGSDPKIIIHQKGKGTGNAYKLIQFRYRTDASSSNKAGQKRIVMRSYVESGDLLYKL